MEFERNRNTGFHDEKMKQNKTTIIYLIAVITISIIVIVLGIASNNYLSEVIISQPFSLVIEHVSLEETKAIKIYGYSPTGKIQVLSKIKEPNTWKYFDYSNFKSLFVFIPDSVENFNKIVITTKNKLIEVTDLKNKISNNYIDLTKYVKGKFSKAEIIFSILHWKESKNMLLLCFAVIMIIMGVSKLKKNISSLFLIFNRSKTTKYPSIILLCLFVIGIIVHVLFFLISKKYLITSGFFLYILISFFIYLVFVAIEKKTKICLKLKEIKLAIITLTFCLCVLELALISKNIIFGKESSFLYQSPYTPQGKNWFYIWSSDHDLYNWEFRFHRIVNTEGLSDIEHPVLKNSNEYRIMGLGDSFTEGHGADADSTWLKFLERNLSKYLLQKQLTFINAGISGSDPYFEYVLLEKKLLKYKPDLVFLVLNFTDIGDIALRGGMERFKADGSVKYSTAPWWEPIFAMSCISRLFFSVLGYDACSLNKIDFEYESMKITEIINKFDTLAVKNNFKFIVIFHPSLQEIRSNKMQLEDVYSKIYRNVRPEVMNMLDYFTRVEKIDATSASDYYWLEDMHNNAKGYAAFARGVEWKLKETGILDSMMKK